MRRAGRAGFTLIEVMIVVAIVAVLTLIAFPSYQDQVRKGKRAEGKAALLQAAQALERYMTANNTYVTNLSTAGYKAYSGETSSTSAYTLAVAAGSTGTIATSYRVTATPTSGWGKNSSSPSVQDDQGCGEMTITQTGAKTASGTLGVSGCW